MWKKSERQAESYKIWIMAVLLTGACISLYYFHVILRIGTIITHIFYVPIILASIWWKRKGLLVALFASGFLVLSHVFLRPDVANHNDYFRAFMFVVTAFVVAELSRRIAKEHEALQAANQQLSADEQRLRAANQQLKADEQQLKAVNQQLRANEQQLVSEIAERKQVEERIREQREFLRNTIESLSHPFYVIDANDKTVKMANSTAWQGKLPEKISCYMLSHKQNKPCSGADHPCPLEDIKKTKQPVIVEHIHYDKDGNPRNIEVYAYPIFDNEQNVTQIIEYCLDITDRKKAEEQIESLARFPSENPYPILRVAENGEILYSNKAGLRILSKWKSGVGKAVPERWQHLIAEVLKSGKSRIQEEVSGEIFSFVISPVIDAGYVNLYARDITKQKRAEKVLRFSLNSLERTNLKTSKASLLEELVKEIQEFTECEAVGIRILDESGNIPYEAYIDFSKEFYELESSLSVKSDKCMCIKVIKGQTDSKLPFYTEGGSFYINGMSRFLDTVSEEDKGRNRNLCNEFGYESVALVPIRLRNALIGLIHVADSRENMVPLYLVEMLEKITTQVTSAIQRVRAEEKLQEHTDQLEEKVKEQTRELCDRVKKLNCLYSISNLLKNPNLSLHELFQATVELIPVSWQYPAITCSRLTLKDERFSTSNFRETVWKQTSDIILHGERIGSVEVCYLEEKPERVEGPFSKEERNLINAVAEFLETITELKLMEQYERKHREEIAHFARLSTIGEMSSALAHELNQPLCAIVTHTEGALRMMKSGDWDSNELLEAMEEAGTQAERAGKIIRRIANLVRKKESHRSGVNIGEIIGETINLIEYEARLKGITIQWVEPSENSPMLEVDRIQIQQVLVNLLHNSFEAMKNVDQSKRQISIEVSTDENDMVQVVVSDTGCGLSAESTDRIFEPFFTTNSQGLGMGLSISRSIIEAHGGRIWAESNPAGGATFRLTLPM